MKRKYKPTGCAKFFLFLIIIIPLAVVGALLIRGEDPREEIPKWFDGESKEILKKKPKKGGSPLEKQIDNLEKVIDAKDKEIQSLQQRIKELESQ